MIKHKGKKAIAKACLDKVCYELSLDMKPDLRRNDYVISKDGIYLFRAVLHSQKEYFGVRFKVTQFAVYNYTEETITQLVNKLIKDRQGRKITIPSDYSKENHIIL